MTTKTKWIIGGLVVIAAITIGYFALKPKKDEESEESKEAKANPAPKKEGNIEKGIKKAEEVIDTAKKAVEIVKKKK